MGGWRSDWRVAYAARFFDRSVDTKTFKRGMDAYNNPDFYRQLGKDPEQVRDALDVWNTSFWDPKLEEIFPLRGIHPDGKLLPTSMEPRCRPPSKPLKNLAL
jgi:hypothetical protein